MLVWDLAKGGRMGDPLPVRGSVWVEVDGRSVSVVADPGHADAGDLVPRRQVGSDLVFPSEVTAVTMVPDGRLVMGFGGDIAALTPRPD
ncbi:hypothetical protein [Streptomyces sp. NTH33]|uniref:hypothetical protein n=1 Tax=Streptomyces sp. NTH33 TaxID=1735453 RepID=UPI0015E8DCFE|nr:hypothetical protein [Streptomyces sp. NTH33]